MWALQIKVSPNILLVAEIAHSALSLLYQQAFKYKGLN